MICLEVSDLDLVFLTFNYTIYILNFATLPPFARPGSHGVGQTVSIGMGFSGRSHWHGNNI
jgi:hypothetical protein